MVHCGAVRQTAAIVHMEQDQIRTGDKTKCRFRFVRNPEFVLCVDEHLGACRFMNTKFLLAAGS
jgi:GTPase